MDCVLVVGEYIEMVLLLYRTQKTFREMSETIDVIRSTKSSRSNAKSYIR
jgi:hypothetical protein